MRTEPPTLSWTISRAFLLRPILRGQEEGQRTGSLGCDDSVLRALTAVHGEGLIHRDVTPDNIYITKDGNVKLLTSAPPGTA